MIQPEAETISSTPYFNINANKEIQTVLIDVSMHTNAFALQDLKEKILFKSRLKWPNTVQFIAVN